MFENAYIISFDAEDFPFLAPRSYYTQTCSPPAELKFAVSRPRASLRGNEFPQCRINFAFEEVGKGHRTQAPQIQDGRYTGDYKRLNIHDTKTNWEIGLEKLGVFLRNVKAYSTIYIAGHGSVLDNHLVQKVTYRKNNGWLDTISISIPSDAIARVLHLGIPRGQREYLKIHLLMCNAGAFASALCDFLLRFGFKNICIVSYTSYVYILGVNFFRKDILYDFFSETHRFGIFHRRDEENKLEDKECVYSIEKLEHGFPQTSGYAKFKKDYWNKFTKSRPVKYQLLSENSNKIEVDNIIEGKGVQFEKALTRLQQLMIFHNCLLTGALKYIDYHKNVNKDKSSNKEQHGVSGKERAYHFIQRINSLILFLYQIQNSNDELDLKKGNKTFCSSEKEFADANFEQKEIALIFEIIYLVKSDKMKGYDAFSGDVNASVNSLFTYILGEIYYFYATIHRTRLQSPILRNFINAMSDCKYTNSPLPDQEGSANFQLREGLFGQESTDEFNREKIKAKIKVFGSLYQRKLSGGDGSHSKYLMIFNKMHFFDSNPCFQDEIRDIQQGRIYIDKTIHLLISFMKILIAFSHQCIEYNETQKQKAIFFSANESREIKIANLFIDGVLQHAESFLSDMGRNYAMADLGELKGKCVEPIIQSLSEIVDLFQKRGRYNTLTGKMSAEKNTFATYLLYALDSFFKKYQTDLTIGLDNSKNPLCFPLTYLQNFFTKLTGQPSIGPEPKGTRKYLFNHQLDCEQTRAWFTQKLEKIKL